MRNRPPPKPQVSLSLPAWVKAAATLRQRFTQNAWASPWAPQLLHPDLFLSLAPLRFDTPSCRTGIISHLFMHCFVSGGRSRCRGEGVEDRPLLSGTATTCHLLGTGAVVLTWCGIQRHRWSVTSVALVACRRPHRACAAGPPTWMSSWLPWGAWSPWTSSPSPNWITLLPTTTP